jgi:phosphohistidine phosphatase
MHLYLVRHGDAIDPSHPSVTGDAMRSLTDLGHEEVAVTARLLGRLGVVPELVLSSPLVRAVQTADIIANALMPEPVVRLSEELAPGGSPAGVLHAVLQHRQSGSVVLTGHNPGIGRLAGFLCWGQSSITVPFRTAGVCRIDLPDAHPEPANGDLRWLMGPRLAERLLGS